MVSCGDCGVDEESISVRDAISAIRTFPRRYREALAHIPPAALRLRPDPETWSALEYAVHAREVLELLALSLPIVLDQPGTRFPSFDVDEAAEKHPDWVLDPELALSGVAKAADALASRADTTPWEAWERTFTIGDEAHPASWIVQHAAHEGSHHLRDIERVGRLVGAAEEDD